MLQYLKKYFGYDSFRPMQEEIIRHILAKKDCLVLMPTGGGKSVCFQIPAIMMEGTAIVVSPLISLMKDQVEALRGNGIPAAALNSNYTEKENRDVRQYAMEGQLKLLYISPEKLLAEKDFLLHHVKVSLFAIDEAHCISQWGHDFRPEYTQMGSLHEDFPDVPIAAFTATADKVTKNDIIEQMHLLPDESGEVKVFTTSFDRPNLSLDVRRGYTAKDKLQFILKLLERHPNESGIIYCLSRKTTEKVAEDLQNKGILAEAYHAGLSAKDRDRVQEDFINERIQVVCATIAFGMGIDKSNVRFVVHYNLPKSIENYYQEIGRGGRDGLDCETVLFYNVGDLLTLRKFANESGQRELNIDKLKRMQEYAESQVCRRRILLNYFSETMDHDCNNCDICHNPPQRFDGSKYVQMALSAMVRTGQKEGFRGIIDVVRGADNYDVRQKGYNKIKTWGVGKDISFKDWQDYLLQMLHLGYIEIDYRDNSHLKVTEQGNDILYGRKKAELAVIVEEDYTIKGRKKKVQQQMYEDALKTSKPEDPQLFEQLRQLRMEIAKEQRVPPYVVFGDKTLHELASQMPQTLDDFGKISGVGEHKQQQYGNRFISAIVEYCKTLSDLPFPPENIPAPQEKKKKNFITLMGIEYTIPDNIIECFRWRPAIEHVERDLYFNLWQDSEISLTEYIPENTLHREEVVKRFCEIIFEALNVQTENGKLLLPKRIEYDSAGKPVHTLKCNDFNDALGQYRLFIEEKGHFPFAGGDEYECSLRRWYQEVTRGIIPVTTAQKLAVNAIKDLYEDVPKTRAQWEKINS